MVIFSCQSICNNCCKVWIEMWKIHNMVGYFLEKFSKSCENIRVINSYRLGDAIRSILFWLNISGISSIIFDNFQFKISKRWMVYSLIVQVVYGLYILLQYGTRFFCENVHTEEAWYLMTFGYFVGDMECLFTICYGLHQSKNICAILNNLSQTTKSEDSLKLKEKLRKLMVLLLGYYCLNVISYTNITILRFRLRTHLSLFGCYSIDSTFAVFIRGITMISPSFQVALIYIITYLFQCQFRGLKRDVVDTINSLNFVENKFNRVSSSIWTANRITPKLHLKTLEELSICHKKLYNILQDFNDCIGPQLLVALSSSLYTTIYSSFRFFTLTWEYNHDSLPHLLHYLLGILYRIVRTIIYMVMGKCITTASLEPLRALQGCSILNLPPNEQQQVQSLMLQWMNKKGYLSALGVFNFGPWLLGPIVGNVITYLLVALQFAQNRTTNNNNNYTKNAN